MRISTNDHRYLLIKARKAACDWAVDGGFPLRRAHVHDVIVGIVKQEQREVRLRLRAGRPYSVSKSSAHRRSRPKVSLSVCGVQSALEPG
jgi:hypothetical protein